MGEWHRKDLREKVEKTGYSHADTDIQRRIKKAWVLPPTTDLRAWDLEEGIVEKAWVRIKQSNHPH